tara:strand:- start:158 stop:280 length:123 start_codon:yes stop_codon:yes gene_type:complete
MGKGSKRRKGDNNKYSDAWELIWGKKKKEKKEKIKKEKEN